MLGLTRVGFPAITSVMTKLALSRCLAPELVHPNSGVLHMKFIGFFQVDVSCLRIPIGNPGVLTKVSILLDKSSMTLQVARISSGIHLRLTRSV